MRHRARYGDWTRSYEYEEPSLIEPNLFRSNRLSRTTVNGRTETYTYDDHGSMTGMPHLAQMDWDFKDQLQRVDLGGGGTAYYVYDATGQRVRKVIERLNGTVQKERIYLGGFEVYREYNGGGEDSLVLERETLHLMDAQQRIAMVETRTLGVDEAPTQLTRYQLSSHLGSASLELDALGQIISYEEYHPYGTSSYQAVRSQTETPKRYRYTGIERDEETGFGYHTARYYSGWLGRWCSCDPGGLAGSINQFNYSSSNPVRHIDRGGKRPWNPIEIFRDDEDTEEYGNEELEGGEDVGGLDVDADLNEAQELPSQQPSHVQEAERAWGELRDALGGDLSPRYWIVYASGARVGVMQAARSADRLEANPSAPQVILEGVTVMIGNVRDRARYANRAAGYIDTAVAVAEGTLPEQIGQMGMNAVPPSENSENLEIEPQSQGSNPEQLYLGGVEAEQLERGAESTLRGIANQFRLEIQQSMGVGSNQYPMYRINLAIAEITTQSDNGDTEVSYIGFSNALGGSHSEGNLIHHLNEMGVDPLSVTAVYSERDFCGEGEGEHNCLGQVQTAFPLARLFFSFNYH